jgi:type III restriction enzyme
VARFPRKRGVGYIGWGKSLYEQAWFVSAPELEVAKLLDESEGIRFWVGLLPKRDLEIAWEGGHYYPDFVAVESDGTHWLVEVKSDKEAESQDVKEKRQAALRWANHVSAAPKLNGVKWRYLLAREGDIKAAKGRWPAMKGLGVA